MKALKDRILSEGKVLPGNILKIDGFLNHQLDITLLCQMGQEFARRFSGKRIDKILTIEASGIAVACIAAQYFGNLPVVFAKKAKSGNLDAENLLQSEIYSYTYQKPVTLTVCKDWLKPGERVLVMDDFLANGEALRGSIDLLSQAGAELVGVGIAVEKGFQGGGDRLRGMGIDVQSLAIVESLEGGVIRFREE